MRSIFPFILFLLLISCKSKAPVASATEEFQLDMNQLSARNAEMYERFVLEHDLFIAFLDRSTQKDDIPYPQLHILIDSIQDFRDMHSLILNELEEENAKCMDASLSSEARSRVEKRMEESVREADRLYSRFSAISGQIENLKFLHRFSQIDADEWLDWHRREFVRLNSVLKELLSEIESEVQALEWVETDEDEAAYTEYIHDLLSVRELGERTMAEYAAAIRQAELTLPGTTIYEGPYIYPPSEMTAVLKSHKAAKRGLEEYDAVKSLHGH